MKKIWMWIYYLRSVTLALRVIAFERFDAFFLGGWAVVSVAVILPSAVISGRTGMGAAVTMLLLYRPMKSLLQKRRYRLVRIGDRIEYAVMEADGDYRQRFETGVVLERFGMEDVKDMKGFDAELMEGSRHFYLIRNADGTRIVTLEQVVGIEIDTLEENTKGE